LLKNAHLTFIAYAHQEQFVGKGEVLQKYPNSVIFLVLKSNMAILFCCVQLKVQYFVSPTSMSLMNLDSTAGTLHFELHYP
jgi:hypothetical protein